MTLTSHWRYLFFFTLFTFPQQELAFNKYKIAAFFPEDGSLERKIFQFAAEEYKDIEIVSHEFSTSNLFNLSSTLCNLGKSGIVSGFSGSNQFATTSVIQSFFDAFDLAHVTYQTEHSKINQAFELTPRFGPLIYSLLTKMEVKKVYVIFDKPHAMNRIPELVNMGPYVIKNEVLRINDNTTLKRRMQEIQNGSIRNIILMLSYPLTELFFQNALKMQMLSPDYRYIIADFRTPCRKLKFKITGKISVTCLQLVNEQAPLVQAFMKRWLQSVQYKEYTKLHPKTQFYRLPPNEIKLEMALAYDSFQVTKAAIKNVSPYSKIGCENLDRICMSRSIKINCFGIKLKQQLSRIKINGLTGNIEFDGNGLRKNFKIEVWDVGFMEYHSKVGVWTDGEGFTEITSSKFPASFSDISDRVMRVTTVQNSPFTMIKEEYKNWNSSEKGDLPNDAFEGYCVDLIKEVAKELNVSYKLTLVKDGKFGAETITGKWNGMIGELLEGEADVALAPLTINLSRQQVVDFTKPFMTLGISIMMRKPINKSDVFSFLYPLHRDIWMCCLFAYMSVSVVLFLVSRFSSTEWHSISVGNENELYFEKENEFGIINCLWFSLGSFMQQGGDVCPTSMPGRIVAASWWFFTMIIISSYTANLAAFLTVDRMKTPITGADDLSSQTAIEYGVLDQSSSQAFFEKSTMRTYRRMWSFMKEKGNFEKTTADGVKRVIESDNYAFLIESSMLEYYNQRKPCTTVQAGYNLNVINYGLATPKNSPYLENLTIVVLQLKSNFLAVKKHEWWVEKGDCNEAPIKKEDTGANALKIDSVEGIFYLISGAIFSAVFITAFEWVFVSVQDSLRFKVPVKKALKSNFNMAVTSGYDPPNLSPRQNEEKKYFGSQRKSYHNEAKNPTDVSYFSPSHTDV